MTIRAVSVGFVTPLPHHPKPERTGSGGGGRTPGPPSARANNLSPLIQEGFQMERFKKAGNLKRENRGGLVFLGERLC